MIPRSSHFQTVPYTADPDTHSLIASDNVAFNHSFYGKTSLIKPYRC